MYFNILYIYVIFVCTYKKVHGKLFTKFLAVGYMNKNILFHMCMSKNKYFENVNLFLIYKI